MEYIMRSKLFLTLHQTQLNTFTIIYTRNIQHVNYIKLCYVTTRDKCFIELFVQYLYMKRHIVQPFHRR